MKKSKMILGALILATGIGATGCTNYDSYVREMENIRLRECAEKGCIDPMNCLDETRSLFRLNQRTLSDRRSLRDRYANRSVAGDAKAVTLEEMRRHPSCTFPEFEIVE